MTLLLLILACLLAGAIALIVRQWFNQRVGLPRVPLSVSDLQTIQAYAVLDSPVGRVLMLDLLRTYVVRDQLSDTPEKTAHQCGEASAVLRLFHMMSGRAREQLLHTFIEEEVNRG